MFTKILAAVVVIGVVFMGIVSTRPSEFRVTRSEAISASPAAAFAQVNDLHKWEAWSPWAKLDPSAKNSFEGPSAGMGATMRWAGNMKVGQGSMTIIESRPNDLVRFKLEFLKPFAATSTAEFTFRATESSARPPSSSGGKPEGHQTVVTWSMYGKNNFMGK